MSNPYTFRHEGNNLYEIYLPGGASYLTVTYIHNANDLHKRFTIMIPVSEARAKKPMYYQSIRMKKLPRSKTWGWTFCNDVGRNYDEADEGMVAVLLLVIAHYERFIGQLITQ